MKLVHKGLAAAVLVMAAMPASANLLINGDFEADNAANVPYYLRQIPTGWSAIAGIDIVDIIHNDYTQPNPIPVLLDAQSGVQFLDLNGADPIGGLQQTVSGLTPGASLKLSLYAGQWVTNSTIEGLPAALSYTLRDAFDNSVLGTGSFTTDMPQWSLLTLQALAPSSGSVIVELRTSFSLQAGPGVDNVSLEQLVGGVPEPASWAMMLFGFGAIGGLMRRRQRLSAKAC